MKKEEMVLLLKRIGPILIVLSLFLLLLPSKQVALRDDAIIDEDNILGLVQEQLDLGPRIPGSEGSLAFKDWIQVKVQSPWIVQIQAFEFKGIELRNYIIKSSNSTPSVLIGAHYDTRAVANEDDNPKNQQLPVPGANDAASGVAAIIEMMQHIPKEYQADIGFLLFDGEDQGNGGMPEWRWIMGSTHYANSMSQTEVDQTDAFILFDMIGDDDLNLKKEQSSDDKLVDAIWDTAVNLGYDTIFEDKIGYNLIDDHKPFINRGITSADIIDFDYNEWHTTLDDIDHISATSIAIVVDVTLNWFLSLNVDSNNTSALNTYGTTSNSSQASNADFSIFYILTFPVLILKRKRITC